MSEVRHPPFPLAFHQHISTLFILQCLIVNTCFTKQNGITSWNELKLDVCVGLATMSTCQNFKVEPGSSGSLLAAAAANWQLWQLIDSCSSLLTAAAANWQLWQLIGSCSSLLSAAAANLQLWQLIDSCSSLLTAAAAYWQQQQLISSCSNLLTAAVAYWQQRQLIGSCSSFLTAAAAYWQLYREMSASYSPDYYSHQQTSTHTHKCLTDQK